MRLPGLFGLLLVICLLLGANQSACGAVVVGTFDVSRGGISSLDGGELTNLVRGALLANFDATITSSAQLSTEFLSSVDMLVLCSSYSTSDGVVPLSAAEQAALLGFVLSGGRAAIVVEAVGGVNSAQSFLSPFDMVIDDQTLAVDTLLIETPSHLVLNGPFGAPAPLVVTVAGWLSDVGPYATVLASMEATGLPVIAAIEANVLGPGSGRVVVMTDASPFADDMDFSIGEPLFLNMMNYLITPVPEPTSGLLMGMAALVLAGWGYRHRGR